LIPVLEIVAVDLWDTDPKSVLPPFTSVIEIGEVFILTQRLAVIVIAAAVMAALFVVLQRSHVGRALRASAQDREMTALLGVDTRRLIIVTFAIGSAVTGLAGALLISLFPVTPYVGGLFIFKAFAVALIGGLGSVTGAVIAAVCVGLAESFLARYVSSGWTDAYVLVLMIVILLLRPTGIVRGTEGSAVT